MFNKRLSIITLLLIIIFVTPTLFATESYITVPLGHRAYTILNNAEIRGIIPVLHNARPYSTSKVLKELQTIHNSNAISQTEKHIIEDIIHELSTKQEDNSFKSVTTYGSVVQDFDDIGVRAEVGARFKTQYTQSLSTLHVIDWRNTIEVYLRADVKNMLSFEMNLARLFDHIDYRPFLKNDFYVDAKGKYDPLWLDEHPFLTFGGTSSPELNLSLLHNKLDIRFASIKRDWGVGTNNLMLSGSANSFNAIEVQYEIVPWLKYSFITGKLGSFSFYDFKDKDDPNDFYANYFFTDDLHESKYDNNYSAHRVEVSLPWNISLGVYESVVYRRRFELGYLNPFAILFYEQEIIGDFDNMLAGLDFEWIIPSYGRVYGSLATTEMSVLNPKRFLTAPRNILGIQGGVDINIPLLPFTTVTAQYTYLAPFFYTHKPYEGNEISFVNEGRNIGYPLRPNSDEILLKIDSQFKEGWDGSFTFKYQRRSGQYGFNIDKFMRYQAAKKNLYEDKDFNAHVFEKAIGMELAVQKTLKNAPVRLRASYLLNLESNRGVPTPEKVWDTSNSENWAKYDEDDHSDYAEYPVIKYNVEGAWSSWKASHAVSIGAEVWF